jgi:hypothetical protein
MDGFCIENRHQKSKYRSYLNTAVLRFLTKQLNSHYQHRTPRQPHIMEAEQAITEAEPVITEPPLLDDSPDKNGQPQGEPLNFKSERKLKVKRTSRLRKSGSTGRVKAHPKLKRTLKRGGHYRLVEDKDARWLYAAYRKGVFSEIERDLSPQDFLEEFIVKTSNADKIYLIVGKTKRGEIPIGVLFFVERNIVDLHVEWFPWASSRNIIESSARVLQDLKKDYNIVITIKDNRDHFILLCRYGLLRSVGKIHNYYGTETGHVFQSVK